MRILKPMKKKQLYQEKILRPVGKYSLINQVDDSNCHINCICVKTLHLPSIYSSNLAEINTKTSEFELMSKGDPIATSASYGGAPAASVSEGDLEPTSDVSVAVRRTRASMNARKSQSTNVKPADPMLTEPPEPSRGNNNRRKAKKVVKQKKWRG